MKKKKSKKKKKKKNENEAYELISIGRLVTCYQSVAALLLLLLFCCCAFFFFFKKFFFYCHTRYEYNKKMEGFDLEVVRIGGSVPEKRSRQQVEEEEEEDEETEESEPQQQQQQQQQPVNPSVVQIGGWGASTVKKVIKKQKSDPTQIATEECGFSAIGNMLAQAQLATLEKEANEDKYTATRYLSIIELLTPHKSNDAVFKKLRQTRNNMSKYCSLSPEQWLSWISEEQDRGTDNNTVYEILKKACEAYTYTPFLMEKCEVYSELLSEMNDEKNDLTDEDERLRITKTCQVYEDALSVAKFDFRRGNLIWKSYRGFYENEDGEGGVLDSNEITQNILSLFSRQLMIAHMTVDETISEANSFFNDINQSNHAELISKIKRVSEMCKTLSKDSTRLDHEKSLSEINKQKKGNSDTFRKTNEKLWLDYISDEQKRDNGQWLAALYERAVCAIPWSAVLWRRMINFFTEKGARSTAYTASKKAVRALPTNHNLWIQRMRAVEKCKDLSFTEATLCVVEASQIKFKHPYDITTIISEYFAMVRRCSHQTAKTAQFRDLYQTVAEKGLVEELGFLSAIHYQCLRVSKDSPASDCLKNAYEPSIKQYPNAGSTWIQYAQKAAEIEDGDKLVTSIFERAVHAVDKDDMPLIIHNWLEYERCYGISVSKIDNIRDRYIKVISDIKMSGTNISKEVTTTTGRGKRLRDEEKQSQKVHWEQLKQDLGLEEPTGPPELTLFLWNVSFASTEQDINKLLTSRGINISSIRLIKQKHGKSKVCIFHN